jgi:transcriptional regulator with XRE-family HTH domain
MDEMDKMGETRDDQEKRYAELVGEKLRRMRQERGLSLQEVCDRSGGSFVVSTLSAYERGKRSLSLDRLCELAAIYGQSPMTVLDIEDAGDIQRSLTNNGPLRIRLDNLERLAPEERRPLETYLSFLRQLRNDPAREMLTIRKEDLAYLSGLYGVRPQALKDYLEKEGILLTW